jgi:hypothetical protein
MLDRKTAEARLLEMAARDPQFRAELTADPRSAIARTLGVNLPAGAQVTVLEETPGQHYLVLPLNPETQPLGAAQLDAVSAGGCYSEPVECEYCDRP